MLAEWDGVSPSFLCDHENSRRAYLVKASAGGLLHWLCDKCYREGAHYAQRVTSVIVQETGEVLESF